MWNRKAVNPYVGVQCSLKKCQEAEINDLGFWGGAVLGSFCSSGDKNPRFHQINLL